MRNTRHQRGFQSKTLAVLIGMYLLAFSAALLPQGVSTTWQASARKVHQWQQESRDLVRLSMRVYRFYKNCSHQPVMQAQNCQ